MKTFALRHAACAMALAGTFGAAAAPAPEHQYRFDGSLADDEGGPALVASGGTLDAGRYAFGQNQGLELPAPIGGTYTIDMVFHFDTFGHNGWAKAIDFSEQASDAGFYGYTTLGWTLVYYDPIARSLGAGAMTGNDQRLTLTRTADGLVSLYIDGEAAISYDDSVTGNFDFGGREARFFFDDAATGGVEAGAGSADYIRTYADALSAADVAALPEPTAPVPELPALALMLAGLAGIGLRRFRPRARRRGPAPGSR
jgi:hypothetical protein